MFPWIILALIAVFNLRIFAGAYYGDCEATSFIIWQVILASAAIVVCKYWKKLSEIKPG